MARDLKTYYRKKTMNGKPGRPAKSCSTTACCPPPSGQLDARPIEGDDADAELAALAKAIGHPARIKILRLLTRRDACICGDLVDDLGLAQSTVSQHLKMLKDAGLIRGEIDGPRVCYCIERLTLRRLRALVAGI